MPNTSTGEWGRFVVNTGRWSDVISDIEPSEKEGRYSWPESWREGQDASEEQKEAVRVSELFKLPAPAVPRNMVRIPGGSFIMGASRFGMTNFIYETMSHTVDTFTIYMDKYEVACGEWDMVREWGLRNGYPDLPASAPADAPVPESARKHPVVNVNWYDCVKWCNAHSEAEGLTPAYYVDTQQTEVYRTGTLDISTALVDWAADGYRLPSEAEWEKGARGGRIGWNYPWGNSLDPGRANYYGSGDPFDPGTTPVGYYDGGQVIGGRRRSVDVGNDYGLYDMIGNVMEWCWDWLGPIDRSPARNPRGPATGRRRIVRGGGWNSVLPERLYCSFRHMESPDSRAAYLGFRCVRRE
jgi:formylglycine-generating enzyme required for sulfatase activity